MLTEYLSWRWTLYVNLIFAGVAFAGGALLLGRQPSSARPRLDIPGVLLEAGGMFCLVYGLSNAASHSWATPSTYGFLAAGVALLAAFAAWQARAAHPLLPPRVVLDRNRSGAYNVGQQIGASIGTSLLNSIFAAAVTAYLTAHLASARLIGRQALTGQALLHGYTTAFWWTAGILAGGAVICGALIRSGPLAQPGTQSPARGVAPAQAEAGPGVPA